MRYSPHPYQQYSTDRIVGQPAIALLYEMGLGKSVITLTAIDRLLFEQFDAGRVLVIAPLRVAQDTWAREAAKWDHLRHLRISKVLGSVADRQRALEAQADIWIINRENVEWLVETRRPWDFDTVVIDELSSFKSASAKRFRALRKVRPRIHRMIGLTGTPAPNGLMDLWAEMYLLDMGESLGKTVTGYRQRYFEPDRRNRDVVWSWKPQAGAEAAIYSRLTGLCVSMKAEDWLQLPGRIDRVLPVPLDEAARRAYLKMERDWLLPLKDTVIDAGSAAVVAGKLLQLAGGAVYDESGAFAAIHHAKLDALEDVIEAANGNPVLVYYGYRHEEARILARFPSARILRTPSDIEAWNSGKVAIMLAHPASAGHGLNLQDGGHTIVWFGPTWSLELYQQANARLHRQGQKHAVIVHHLIAEGTIDEQVMKVLETKGAGQERLLQAVKERIERCAEEEP